MVFPIIVASLFVICFIIYFYKQSQIKKHGITTEATVTRIVETERSTAEGFDHTTVYVHYDDENGEEQEAILSTVPDVCVGGKIRIRYNPKDKGYANYVKENDF